MFGLLESENITGEQAYVGLLPGREIKNPHAMVCLGVNNLSELLTGLIDSQVS
jgi:hypothetical protein